MEVIEHLKTKYEVSEESQVFIKTNITLAKQLLEAATPDTDRESYATNHAELNGDAEFEFEGTVREFFVPSLALPSGIPIDVIKPHYCPRRPGILVYFHGGGNVYGSRKTAELSCKLLANELKCVLVNVEYRLAPEHKFPAMFDDAKCVTRWVLMNKALIGGENNSKVGVCGSSAGGGIAATVAFEIPAIDYQILVYPLVDWRCEGGSYDEFNADCGGFNFTSSVMKVIDRVVVSEEDKVNVRASPLLQKNFSKLPPSLVIIAEIDPLRSSNYEFRTKLKAANVPCQSKLMKGTVHGFFSLPGIFPKTHRQVRAEIAKFYSRNGTC